MIFNPFRRSPNAPLIDRLHGEMMAQARNPALFIDYGVADTPEGRFEMVAIHVLLAIRRLAVLEPPGPQIAQDLTDCMFRHFDIAFREMGVGDVTVPKRMKKHASNWLGRARVYGEALDRGDLVALACALNRNVYGDTGTAGPLAERLSRYMTALSGEHSRMPLTAYMEGAAPVIAPQTII